MHLLYVWLSPRERAKQVSKAEGYTSETIRILHRGGEMVDGKWQPNKEGLGLGKVLDYIGVDY